MSKFTPDQIPEMVKEYIRETLDNDEQCRAISGKNSDRSESLEGKSVVEASNMRAEEAQSLLTSVTRWLQESDHELMLSVTNKLIATHGYSVDLESDTFKTLNRELLKAFKQILEVRIVRSEGDYSTPDHELIPILQSPLSVSGVPICKDGTQVKEDCAEVVRFSEVQERYVDELERGNNWRPKTRSENVAIFNIFTEAMGDMDVKKIDRKTLIKFKEILTKLPANRDKLAIYRGKSIEEAIAMETDKPISTRTVNKYLERIGGLFNYAVNNGDMLSNPSAGLKIKIKTRPNEERDPFTGEDLHKLFSSDDYLNGKHKYPYRFWLPLIAIYTGCRLEEMCQLHLENIKQDNGVWVFDINEKSEGRQLKNSASTRLIPIHPHLIALGLLERAKQLREKGEIRLFPELLNKQYGKYGHYVGRWFAIYKNKCGVTEGKKSFHSFRHAFMTHLKSKFVEPIMIEELAGHAAKGEFGRYADRFTPDILLKSAIEKIDYGINLNELNSPDKIVSAEA